MTATIQNKTCAVIGASSGIGQAVAQALAGAGARVIGYARRFTQERLLFVPGPGDIHEVRLDITDQAQVETRFAELPTLDVLINAAGLGLFAPVLGTEPDAMRTLFEVHVMGTFLCCREAVRSMQNNPTGGHIITIGSIAEIRYLPGCGAYAAAKSAQAMLARALCEENRAAGVRVTHMRVGAVDTNLWNPDSGAPAFERARMMQPAQVAEIVLDVLSRPQVSLESLTLLPPAGTL